MASPSSSDRARALVVALASAVSLASASGCVTVRPEQREFLADRSMTFGSGGQLEADTDHVLDNREGSAGASTVSGGGCGCN